MNQVTPAVRDLARWVLAQEKQGKANSLTAADAAFSAFEQLRARWTKIIGVNGYQALLSRALVLARVSVSGSLESDQAVWLATAQVNADGVLNAGEPTTDGESGNHGAEVSVEVMAQMLGLLISFIGEELTFSLVRDVWPGALMSEGNSVGEGATE